MRNLILFLSLFLVVFSYAQLTPQQANREMVRGINLGNTLEAPTEGAWNNGPVQQYYFDDYKEAGFTSVRIPVRWDNYTQKNAPYKVNNEWMNRIEQVVDWALERDLYVVINTHHDDWIKSGYEQKEQRDRFDSIWSQISVRFQDKPEKLLFEMINEPHGISLANINELNARVLSIIRKTNPTRIVLFSGHMWSNSAELIAAAIPDDPYIMGYFHSYDPYLFGLEGQGTWGTQSDINSMKSKFKSVKDWSEENNIPVTINEFGAINTGDYNSGMYHYASYVEEALRSNFSFNAWDDGGNFRIYQRATRGWNDIKDILIYTNTFTPTKVNVATVRDSVLQVKWENRHETADSIFIERRTENSQFQKIASLEHTTSVFEDYNITIGNYYYYRVVLHYADTTDFPSYPQRGLLLPYERSPFHGEAYKIPAVIQAEDYDIGGEGLTYHDKTANNRGGAYRTNEGVDISARADGGYHISHVEVGEWMEYSVTLPQDDIYVFTAHVASVAGGGRMALSFGYQSVVFDIPATGSWSEFVSLERERQLNAGEHKMRLRIISLPAYNIDRIEITQKSTASLIENITPNYRIFSHHEGIVPLQMPDNERGTITFFDITGKQLKTEIINSNLNEYHFPTNGIMIYIIKNRKGEKYTGKLFVK